MGDRSSAMDDLNRAIAAYLRGQLDLGSLLHQVDVFLEQSPRAAADLAQAVDTWHHKGQFPADGHAAILAQVRAFQARHAPPPERHAPARQPPGPQAEEATQVAPETGPEVSGPGPADQQETIASSAPQPGMPPAPTGPVSSTPSGHRSATPVSSKWSHPEDWTGPGGAQAVQEGSVLKDRFVLQERIGQGGMGVVYRATDRRKLEADDRNPYVAIKVLNEDFRKHPKSLVALQREARKAQDLAHPNIVYVSDFDRDGATVFMTMEFLEGRSLDKLIREVRGKGLPMDQAYPLIEGMARALAYAHQKKVVHSDFKPSNVFLTGDDTVKVFDFGIARAAKGPESAGGEVTRFDAGTLGALTPAYASPEMLAGGRAPDARDDIYALACVAYELITGRHPFDKTPANQAQAEGLQPERPNGLSRRQWHALQRGLAFDRAGRTPGVQAFLNDLKPRKDRTWLIVAGSVAALALIAVLAWRPLQDLRKEHRAEALIAELRSGDRDRIKASLAQVGEAPPEVRGRVTREAREAIIGYYESRSAEAVDATRERYAFDEALDWIAQAARYYPDSARLDRARQGIESRRNQLLNDLTRRFNAALAEGRLLPDPQVDDVTDVLALLERIDAGHPLLRDPRLAAAYAERTDKALAGNQLGRADRLLSAALERFGEQARLVNLRDKLRARQEAERARLAREAAEGRIRAALDATPDLDGLIALAPDVALLRARTPDRPLLARLAEPTRQLLAPALDEALEERRWARAEGLLEAVQGLAPDDFLATQRMRLAQAEQAYQARLDGLFSDFYAAVEAGRLDGPDADTATALLAEIERGAASDARLANARASLAQAYLQRAREARAQEDFDGALAALDRGAELAAQSALAEGYAAEREAIAAAAKAQQARLEAAQKARAERQRQARIRHLAQRFEDSLAAMPLTREGARRVLETLPPLAAESPDHPLLEQGRERVAARFLAASRGARAQGDWARALAVAEAAVAALPEDPALAQHLAATRSAYQAAQRLDELLSSLRPGAVAAGEGNLPTVIRQEVDRLVALHDWPKARAVIGEFDPYLGEAVAKELGTYIDRAEAAFVRTVDARFADLRRSVAEGRLAAPAQPNAEGLLADLAELVPNDPRLAEARDAVAGAYLEAARAAVSRRAFDEARVAIARAEAQEPSAAVEGSLDQARAAIAAAEEAERARQLAEQRVRERAQRIAALRQDIEQRLPQMAPTAAAAREMLDVIDRLAALAPADPLVKEGPQRVAERLVSAMQDLRRAGRWDDALAAAEQAVTALPQSDRVVEAAAALHAANDQRLAAERQQTVHERQRRIEAVVAEAKLSVEWESRLQRELRGLQDVLPADDPYFQRTRERVAGLYLEKAREMRRAQRFVEARSLLEKGQRFAPELAGLGEEASALDTAERAFDQEQREKARLAEIEGLKQTLLTQARANDTQGARRTLKELAGVLPEGDTFLTRSAPEAIGGAYLRLARRLAQQGKYAQALKLVRAGQAMAPSLKDLEKARAEYQAKAQRAELEERAGRLPAARLNELAGPLDALRRSDPAGYRGLEDDLSRVLAQRVARLADEDPAAARGLLEAARRLLPDDRRLARVTPPPLPSRHAGRVRELVAAGRLNEAQDLLTRARREEGSRGDLDAAAGALADRRGQAEAALNALGRALSGRDVAAAESHLARARELWSDNPALGAAERRLEEARRAAARPSRPTGALPPGRACKSGYAGYGRRARAACYDMVSASERGPILVVVPNGGTIAKPFAIGKYEVSVGDFNAYCRLSGECSPLVAEDDKLPATGIALVQAKAYVDWLSRTTGHTYRIPTAVEWQHAAQAGGAQPDKDFNCLLRLGSKVIKGFSLIDVRSGNPNGWGLLNYVGNAQEWVLTGSGAEARGGSYRDSMSNCEVGLSRRHAGQADATTGFRVMRELGPSS
jgi:predicted Ser/Thr protein kinase